MGASSIVIVVGGGAVLEDAAERIGLSVGDVLFVPHSGSGKLVNASHDFLAYRAHTPQKA